MELKVENVLKKYVLDVRIWNKGCVKWKYLTSDI